VPIQIQAAFNPLSCNSTSAVLGSAGPRFVEENAPGAEFPNYWYHEALANKEAGVDLTPPGNPPGDNGSDINAQFNSNLGATGCVSYMFDKKGVIEIEFDDVADIDEDEITMFALDCGAEDVSIDETLVTVYTAVEDFSEVSKAFAEAGSYNIISAELSMVPQNTIELTDEQEEKFMKMIDGLEDNDDVQDVWHNLD
jgi:hypothetical protein